MAALLLLTFVGATPGAEIEIAGDVDKLPETHGPGADYKLVGDAKFAWKLKRFAGNLDLNGHTLVMDTGGGNQTVFSGAISGAGRFEWNAGGNQHWQTVPSFLRGDRPNTFRGPLIILRGTLALAKPAGVDAVPGELVLGGGGNQAIVRLDAAHQIKDSSNISIAGPHEGRIWTQGFAETVGTLDLRAPGYLDLGAGAGALTFADSSGREWDLSKTLTIRHWTAGEDEVVFGKGRPGLTPEQLARVGFADPSNYEPGLYTARLLPDGRLEPDAKVAPVNPPFAMSAPARAARERIYNVSGLARLSGKDICAYRKVRPR